MNPLQSQMRISEQGIDNVNSNLMDWMPVDGAPGNYLKVLTIDRENHRKNYILNLLFATEFAH